MVEVRLGATTDTVAATTRKAALRTSAIRALVASATTLAGGPRARTPSHRLLGSSRSSTARCASIHDVYVTGESNGGIFLYELAASYLATSFAAYMPIVGSPHRDFAAHFPLGGPVAFFGIWGRNDATIPPIANPSVVGHPGDKDVALDTQWKGYYFRTADATAAAWARENRCANASQSPLLNTSSAGTSISGARDGCGDSEACRIAMSASSGWGAACKGWAAETCEGSAAVLLCLHPRGHETPPWAPAAVVAFMREHNRQEARSAGSGNRVVMEGNGSVLMTRSQTVARWLSCSMSLATMEPPTAAFSVTVPALLFLAGCAALYYLRRRGDEWCTQSVAEWSCSSLLSLQWRHPTPWIPPIESAILVAKYKRSALHACLICVPSGSFLYYISVDFVRPSFRNSASSCSYSE